MRQCYKNTLVKAVRLALMALILCCVDVAGFLSSAANAQTEVDRRFELAPLLAFEQASNDATVDGVSSPYKFGAAGVLGTVHLTDSVQVGVGLGFGLAPNQPVSISGRSFKGDFIGVYTNLALSAMPLQAGDYRLGFTIEHETQSVKSTNLMGFGSNAGLVGRASSVQDTNKLALKVQTKALASLGTVAVQIGISDWSFRSDGEAQSDGGFPITKTISAQGEDPFFNVELTREVGDLDVSIIFGIQKRSFDVVSYFNRIQMSVAFSF